MAISSNFQTASYDNSDKLAGNPYSTASITPTGGGILVADLDSGGASTAPAITPSGLSGTWTSQSSQTDGVMWQGCWTCTDYTGSGVITLTQAADCIGCAWVITEYLGIDPSGTIVQLVVGGGPGDTTPATAPTIALSAAADSNNRPHSHWEHRTSEATNPRTNWTELADNNNTTPSRGFETQWRSDTFETTAGATWTTSSRWQGYALELKAQTAVFDVPLLRPVPQSAIYLM